MSNLELLSVSEAAKRASVSTKTIRAWIKDKKLPADKIHTPYGDAYQIRAEDLDAVKKVLAVVTVERPADARTVALAVVDAMAELRRQVESVVDLHRQMDELKSALEKSEAERAREKGELLAVLERSEAERAKQHAELLAALQQSREEDRRSWWRRMLGS